MSAVWHSVEDFSRSWYGTHSYTLRSSGWMSRGSHLLSAEILGRTPILYERPMVGEGGL